MVQDNQKRVKALQVAGADEALDRLVDEEYEKQAKKSGMSRVLGRAGSFAKNVAWPAAFGAFWGATTGHIDAVREGAYFGASLGATAYIAFSFISSIKSYSKSEYLPISKKKEEIRKRLISTLLSEQNPKLYGLVFTGATIAIYSGASILADFVMPSDNIGGYFHIDHGLAAKIGVLAGLVVTVKAARDGRNLYRRFQAALGKDRVIEVDYKVVLE